VFSTEPLFRKEWLNSFPKVGGEHKFVLNESDKIVNDQKEPANHLNNFFSTVDENIRKDTVYDPSVHPNLIEIKKQNDCTNKFVFEKVTTDKVKKYIVHLRVCSLSSKVDHLFHIKVLLVLSLIYPEKH
jgi:hypothetical protein